MFLKSRLVYAALTFPTERTRKRFIEIDSVRSILRRSPRSAGMAKVDATPVREAATGAADAVHEIFCHLGHVEVNHVRDVGNVDAARGNVGGHQHAMTALGKAAQSRVALRLRTVAVNLRGRPAGTREAAGNAIGAMLGAHKDEEAALLGVEQVFEQFLLLVGFHFKGAQLNIFGGLEHRTDLDPRPGC